MVEEESTGSSLIAQWLRIQHCPWCGMGSTPGPRASTCWGAQQKQTNKQKETQLHERNLGLAVECRKILSAGGRGGVEAVSWAKR